MDLSVYTISGQKEAVQAAYANNRKLISIRWIYVGVLAVVASVVSILSTHLFNHAIIYGAILIGVFTINAILLLVARMWKMNYGIQQTVTVGQLALDLGLAGVVTYAQGGVEARTTVMYMFPILATGLLFSVAAVRWVALCSGVVYIAMIVAYDMMNTSEVRWVDLAVPLVFYPVIFLLLAQIVTYLIRSFSLETREKAYDAYLSLLAHQLKHPVSAASMIIDTITHDPRQIDPTTKRYMDMLQGENENLVRMIDNLLASAVMRKPQLRQEEFDLMDVLRRVAAKAARTNDRTDDMRMVDDGTKIVLRGDSIRLGLALLNILDNAFRYSPEGSEVECEIKQSHSMVHIIIRDKGAGVNKHLFRYLYKKYAPNLGNDQKIHLGGVGLGLYVAKEIIESHGGTMNIETSKDEGTSVIVSLKGAKES